MDHSDNKLSITCSQKTMMFDISFISTVNEIYNVARWRIVQRILLQTKIWTSSPIFFYKQLVPLCWSSLFTTSCILAFQHLYREFKIVFLMFSFYRTNDRQSQVSQCYHVYFRVRLKMRAILSKRYFRKRKNVEASVMKRSWKWDKISCSGILVLPLWT